MDAWAQKTLSDESVSSTSSTRASRPRRQRSIFWSTPSASKCMASASTTGKTPTDVIFNWESRASVWSCSRYTIFYQNYLPCLQRYGHFPLTARRSKKITTEKQEARGWSSIHRILTGTRPSQNHCSIYWAKRLLVGDWIVPRFVPLEAIMIKMKYEEFVRWSHQ